MVDVRPISLESASCLKAPVDSFKVSIIQPVGKLNCGEELGPHYSEETIDEMNSKLTSFLKVSKENDAELVLAPEYFASQLMIKQIILDPLSLKDNAIYVLPIETLTEEGYSSVKQFAIDAGWDVKDNNPTGTGTNINAAAIILKNETERKFILQAKVYRSPLEELNLKTGQFFFAIEGTNNVLILLICSDANDETIHHKYKGAAARKIGAIIVHSQWNPTPDFQKYESLRSNILDNVNGVNRLLFSINWGRESTLSKGQKICLPRGRIFRGKTLKNDQKYVDRSVNGLHLQKYTDRGKGYWEIWHLLPTDENVYILDMVRPFNDGAVELVNRQKGILSAKYYSYENSTCEYIEGAPKLLTEPFWKFCQTLGIVPEEWPEINLKTLSELEFLCSASLIIEDETWLRDDPVIRIPTALYLCKRSSCVGCPLNGMLCTNERIKWEEKSDYFCQVLNQVKKIKMALGANHCVKVPEKYPFNLSNDKPDLQWVFNGKAINARLIEKQIASIFNKAKIDSNSPEKIILFPLNVNGSINKNNIFPPDVTNPIGVSDSVEEVVNSNNITINIV